MKTVLIRIAMLALAFVAMFLVYDFGTHVFPWWVALASASALASVYVGLAFAPIPAHQRHMAVGIGALAMGIEMTYGTLAVLYRMEPDWFSDMPGWASITLALLHGAPFTLLLFLVTVLIVHIGEPEQEPDIQDITTLVQTLRPLLEQQDAPNLPATPTHTYRCDCGAAFDRPIALATHARTCSAAAARRNGNGKAQEVTQEG